MASNILKISIVFLSLLLAAASSAEELIQNGGFESGELSPWEKIGTTNSWTVTSDQALEGMYCGYVEGAHQLRQSFEPRLGSNFEVFSVAVMAAMGGTYPKLEIHYADEGEPTLVNIPVSVAFTWYSFDFLDQIDPNREVCGVVLTGHPSGSSSYHRRTWFDAVTLQNNSLPEPAEPTEPDVNEVMPAQTKKMKVQFNLKKEQTHFSLNLLADGVPEGIQGGPVEIRVLVTQGDVTTEFEAVAELEEVPQKKSHIIQLMDTASAAKLNGKPKDKP